MKRDQIYKINVERLGRWKERLTEEHATPALIIAVTHEGGKNPTGQIIVQTTEDLTEYQLMMFCQEAARQLQASIAAKQ